MGDVVLGVEIVRQFEPGKIGKVRGNDFLGRWLRGENLLTDFGEFQIGFTGDNVIGEFSDELFLSFVTNFGSAENNGYIRTEALEGGDEFGGLGNVPDINAEADDFWVLGEEDFGNVGGAMVDFKFEDAGVGFESAEVGQEVAQAKGAMNVLGVQGGQDDIWH